MRRNVKVEKQPPVYTHEGAVAARINPEQQLRRLVMSCMLWEDNFYIDGVSVVQMIHEAVGAVSPQVAFRTAVEARTEGKLRHVPLLMARSMLTYPRHKFLVKDVLNNIIQRPDELTEFLSIYWDTNNGKKAIPAQVKKGLASAFTKFNEYALQKYNRTDRKVKLKDVMKLVHPTPLHSQQADMWKRLLTDSLATPDTWEVAITKKNDKEGWERLLRENKLGGLALLRNLRNMLQAGVEIPLIRSALQNMNVERILPFRFIAAKKYAPVIENELEQAMFKCIEGMEKLPGKTVLLVDVSGSMYGTRVSNKSDLTRSDAALGLAMLARELCEEVKIYSFSNNAVLIPNRRGFPLSEAIDRSQGHGGTYLAKALETVKKEGKYDRLIVFTDEQSKDGVCAPSGGAKGYMINVANYRNGVGYGRNWIHIDGFSENTLRFIQEVERG